MLSRTRGIDRGNGRDHSKGFGGSLAGEWLCLTLTQHIVGAAAATRLPPLRPPSIPPRCGRLRRNPRHSRSAFPSGSGAQGAEAGWRGWWGCRRHGSSLEGQRRRGGGGRSRGASRRSPINESLCRGRSGFQAPSSPLASFRRRSRVRWLSAEPGRAGVWLSLQLVPLSLAARGGPHCCSGGLMVPANTSLPRPPLPSPTGPFPTMLPAHQLCSVWLKQVSITRANLPF